MTGNILNLFTPPVARWFKKAFHHASPVQEKAWPVIRQGKNCLILAPTGSGKTLAAFLMAIDSLLKKSLDACKTIPGYPLIEELIHYFQDIILDPPGLETVLRNIAQKKVVTVFLKLDSPSPFTQSLEKAVGRKVTRYERARRSEGKELGYMEGETVFAVTNHDPANLYSAGLDILDEEGNAIQSGSRSGNLYQVYAMPAGQVMLPGRNNPLWILQIAHLTKEQLGICLKQIFTSTGKNRIDVRIPLPFYFFILLYLALFIILSYFLIKKRLPYPGSIMLYLVVLLLMSFFALLRIWYVSAISFSLVFAGSLLFLFSNIILMIHTYMKPYPHGKVFVMFFYISAQLCIVLGSG
ncbi:MAG: DEAD/DEAH box helicase [Spirochaetales bacterium]|nr:DEAD/DEAH box helicase [Spirochaetales bacterium]